MDSAQVKEFFQRVSVDWDEMRSSFYNGRVIDALAERTETGPSATVVDVGTGTGFVAAGLAGRVGSVIGVDNSPAMLAVARSNLAALGATNVVTLEGEMDALPLADDSADVAVANMVLHHVPDPTVMVAEMARVVRPGRKIAITDAVEHDFEWMRTEQADIWLGFPETKVEEHFAVAGLIDYGYASLGVQ